MNRIAHIDDIFLASAAFGTDEPRGGRVRFVKGEIVRRGRAHVVQEVLAMRLECLQRRWGFVALDFRQIETVDQQEKRLK